MRLVEELLEPEPAKYLYCSVVQVNRADPLGRFRPFRGHSLAVGLDGGLDHPDVALVEVDVAPPEA